MRTSANRSTRSVGGTSFSMTATRTSPRARASAAYAARTRATSSSTSIGSGRRRLPPHRPDVPGQGPGRDRGLVEQLAGPRVEACRGDAAQAGEQRPERPVDVVAKKGDFARVGRQADGRLLALVQRGIEGGHDILAVRPRSPPSGDDLT